MDGSDENTDQELQELRESIGELSRKVERLTEQVVESRLEAWNGRLENLELQAHLGQMELRDEAQSRLDQVRESWSRARRTLDDVGDATGAAFESAMDDLKPALTELRTGLEEAAKALRR